MIFAALKAKLREHGPAVFALDATIALGSTLYFSALTVVLVCIAIPVAAFELLAGGYRAGCRCVNSFDECRCGRGDVPPAPATIDPPDLTGVMEHAAFCTNCRGSVFCLAHREMYDRVVEATGCFKGRGR